MKTNDHHTRKGALKATFPNPNQKISQKGKKNFSQTSLRAGANHIHT